MDILYKKNLITSYMHMFIAILLPFFVTPYLVNHLGKEQYGLWVLLTSIIAYFSLSSFGFTTTLLKQSSSRLTQLDELSKIVSVTFFSLFAFSIMIFLVFIIMYVYFTNIFSINENLIAIAKDTFIIVFILFMVLFFTSIYDTLLFASQKLYIKNILEIFKNICVALLSVYLVSLDFGVYEIALMNLVVHVIYFMIIKALINKHLKYYLSIKYLTKSNFKEMLNPSMHYFILGVAGIIIFNSDNIILASYISLSAVAVYSLGYKIVDAVQKIIFKLVDILMPNIALLNAQKDYKRILKLHNKMIFISVSISIPIYIFLFFTNQWLMSIWVGKDNVLDKNIMAIFIIFSFIHTWVHVSAVFVAAIGIHKETSYVALFEAVLNIFLSIVLINFFGVLGVALGTLIAHILTNAWFVNYWFYKSVNLLVKEREVEIK